MKITITPDDIPAKHSLAKANLCVPYRVIDDREADAVMNLGPTTPRNLAKEWQVLWIQKGAFVPDIITDDLCGGIMVMEFAEGESLTILPAD